MSDFTIRLIFNLKTGKTDVHIDMDTSGDAMPMEHEKDHRDLIEAILGRGILKPDELGEIVVGRGETEQKRTSSASEEPPEATGLEAGSSH